MTPESKMDADEQGRAQMNSAGDKRNEEARQKVRSSYWKLNSADWADRIAADFPAFDNATVEALGRYLEVLRDCILEDAEYWTDPGDVAAEREACAAIADEVANGFIDQYCCKPTAESIAAAIRARGEQTP